MKNLFINFSKDPNGLTADIANHDLGLNDLQTINFVEKTVYPLGKSAKADDQFMEICQIIKQTDNLVLGTPVYWSSMTSYMKIFIERMTEVMGDNNPFDGKNLYLIIDGSDPSDAIPHIKHVFDHITERFGMNFVRTITN